MSYPDGYCQACGDKLPPYSGYGPKRKFCVKASCNAQSRGKTINFTITKLTKSWTKYEGARSNLTHSSEDWNCQACGSEMPGEMPAYRFPFDDSNMLRICPMCQHKALMEKVISFSKLVKLVRPDR